MLKTADIHTAIKAKTKDKKGALLWELMLVLAVLFIFLYCCISLLGVFVQFETMSYATKTVARQIEVSGEYNYDQVQNDLNNLLSDKFIIDPHGFTGTVSSGKIQLRDTFTITVNVRYQFTLAGFNGSLWGSRAIEVPMTYTVTGMSEVYHRDYDDGHIVDIDTSGSGTSGSGTSGGGSSTVGGDTSGGSNTTVGGDTYTPSLPIESPSPEITTPGFRPGEGNEDDTYTESGSGENSATEENNNNNSWWENVDSWWDKIFSGGDTVSPSPEITTPGFKPGIEGSETS